MLDEACIGGDWMESFERSADQHGHLLLWNGCSHSVTWKPGETFDINCQMFVWEIPPTFNV